MNNLNKLIDECVKELLNEGQLDDSIQSEADVSYFLPTTGKEVKFKYNFLTARDKDLNKIIDIIKKKYPYVGDVDLSLNDELELMRQSKQNGSLNSSNNKLYLYCDASDGHVSIKVSKNKNFAKQKSLSTKIG